MNEFLIMLRNVLIFVALAFPGYMLVKCNVIKQEQSGVQKCHAKGIKVNAWTVNDPEDAKRLMEYGLDYITTNILESVEGTL